MKIKIGDKLKILGLNAKNQGYRQKFLSLGLIPGTIISIINKAPFGDPFVINCRGTALSLRSSELAMLRFEAV